MAIGAIATDGCRLLVMITAPTAVPMADAKTAAMVAAIVNDATSGAEHPPNLRRCRMIDNRR